MATATELYKSRDASGGDSSTNERSYIVEGTEDEDEAQDAVAAEAPAALGEALRVLPARLEEIAPGYFTATVQYRNPSGSSNPDRDLPDFSFNTAGGTLHIEYSKSQVHAYPAPGSGGTPLTNGAIGWDGERIAGTDIVNPVYAFAEGHTFDAEDVTSAYKRAIFVLTGRTNNGDFKGLAAGECLFLGGSGSRRGISPQSKWRIDFQFAGSPNITGQKIGPIEGIAKKGFEYLWVLYDKVKSNNRLMPVPSVVYIERVYDEGDFTTLGIGVD